MTTSLLSIENAPLVIHKQWKPLWGADFADDRLRDEVFENPRFKTRIGVEISNAEMDETEQDADALELLSEAAAFNSEDGFWHVGLMWLAPRLYPNLFDPATRQICGTLKNHELASLHRFRNHMPAERMDTLTSETDVIVEGHTCLMAWVSGISEVWALRMKLQENPKEAAIRQHKIERAELVGQVIGAKAAQGDHL